VIRVRQNRVIYLRTRKSACIRKTLEPHKSPSLQEQLLRQTPKPSDGVCNDYEFIDIEFSQASSTIEPLHSSRVPECSDSLGLSEGHTSSIMIA
jgi:hypothetical protein